METAWLQAHIFYKVLKEHKSSAGIIITFQVMAVTRVSPRNPHAIRPMPEGGKNKLWADTA